jgi:hypothetical protein
MPALHPLYGQEINAETYLLVVNAANIDKDWTWCNRQNKMGAVLYNASDEIAQLAVQGPMALKAMQEIRGQLSLQLDIFKTLYDVQAIADFQKEILTAIGEVDSDVRDRIIQRLKEAAEKAKIETFFTG